MLEYDIRFTTGPGVENEIATNNFLPLFIIKLPAINDIKEELLIVAETTDN